MPKTFPNLTKLKKRVTFNIRDEPLKVQEPPPINSTKDTQPQSALKKNVAETVREPQLPSALKKNAAETVPEPQLPSALKKNATETVQQPQLSSPLKKNTAETVQEPQVSLALKKNAVEAVREPHVPSALEKNAVETVRESQLFDKVVDTPQPASRKRKQPDLKKNGVTSPKKKKTEEPNADKDKASLSYKTLNKLSKFSLHHEFNIEDIEEAEANQKKEKDKEIAAFKTKALHIAALMAESSSSDSDLSDGEMGSSTKGGSSIAAMKRKLSSNLNLDNLKKSINLKLSPSALATASSRKAATSKKMIDATEIHRRIAEAVKKVQPSKAGAKPTTPNKIKPISEIIVSEWNDDPVSQSPEPEETQLVLPDVERTEEKQPEEKDEEAPGWEVQDDEGATFFVNTGNPSASGTEQPSKSSEVNSVEETVVSEADSELQQTSVPQAEKVEPTRVKVDIVPVMENVEASRVQMENIDFGAVFNSVLSTVNDNYIRTDASTDTMELEQGVIYNDDVDSPHLFEDMEQDGMYENLQVPQEAQIHFGFECMKQFQSDLQAVSELKKFPSIDTPKTQTHVDNHRDEVSAGESCEHPSSELQTKEDEQTGQEEAEASMLATVIQEPPLDLQAQQITVQTPEGDPVIVEVQISSAENAGNRTPEHIRELRKSEADSAQALLQLHQGDARDPEDIPLQCNPEMEQPTSETVPATRAQPQPQTFLLNFREALKKKIQDTPESTSSLTPLEQQVAQLKEKHPDKILFVECGYKYRFFGTDAEIAAKELDICVNEEHNVATASIPTPRLFVHVRRMVSKGYKVGVVKQMESAALKENRNGIFERELVAIYTKSTLIGEDVVAESHLSEQMDPLTTYLICICEGPCFSKKDDSTGIGLVAVQPSTGDLVYDYFDDDKTRENLETRLAHINPVEILLPENASRETTRLLNDLASHSNEDERPRIEQLDELSFRYSTALAVISDFYQEMKECGLLERITKLPSVVVCCLAVLITYLQDFNLQRALKASSLMRLPLGGKYMELNAVTLRNLEIFKSYEGDEGSSLFAILNKTCTKFGRRLLRKWVSQPLAELSAIEERQDIVTELCNSKSDLLRVLKSLLKDMPDVERMLLNVFHKKVSSWQLYHMCRSLNRFCNEVNSASAVINNQIKNTQLRNLLREICTCLQSVKSHLSNMRESVARQNQRTGLFVNETAFPGIMEQKEKIRSIEEALDKIKEEMKSKLKAPYLRYLTVAGQEYLIEVKRTQCSNVPDAWNTINATKSCIRYRPPEVEEQLRLLQKHRELLNQESTKAWLQFLDEFNRNFHQYRKAITKIATLDVYFTLAAIANAYEYSRPVFIESGTLLNISGGRHPMVSQSLQQYVPNDTQVDVAGKRVMVISGPNMGGKSCYLRQVALIAILAQMGSYVPASSATVSVLDSIYVRMGGSDDIYRRRSTLMSELLEAADALKKASSKSLLIFDELGRGTSTHDGVAIAHATLDHILNKIKCLCLFVTHYPSLNGFERRYPNSVSNYHMAFMIQEQDATKPEMDSSLSDKGQGAEEEDDDEVPVAAVQEKTQVLTLLYRLQMGSAEKSYGLNVARLAGIPDAIIRRAVRRVARFEEAARKRKTRHDNFLSLWTLKQGEVAFNFPCNL